jgi:MFS family permease
MAIGLKTPDASQKAVSWGVVAAIVAGNALEFFDFVTYAFFAVYIGKAFFPETDPTISLLLSVAVFGIGFFFRPLGGILIGAYADRAGRRPALLLTIALITLGTLGLVLTPTYASIGIAAPIIVILARLVQGFALGGDVGPASAFLLEIAPAAQRGLYASWQLATQGLAVLVGGALGFGLTQVMSNAALADWGWRLPFLFGLLLIPIAIYMRQAIPETHFSPRGDQLATAARLGDHTRTIVLSVLVVLGGTVPTYVGTYMTTYAIHTLKMPPANSLLATIVLGIATFLFSLIGGWMSDVYGRRIVMISTRALLAIVIVPAFAFLIAAPTTTNLLVVTTVLAALTGISGAVSLVVVPELFPGSIRATGMAIAYAVGVSIFGGTTQFIITWLIGITHLDSAPAWYVVLTSIISIIAMLMMPETGRRALED